MGRKKSLTLIVCISLVLMLTSMLILATQGATQPKASQAKKLNVGCIVAMTGWFSVLDMLLHNEAEVVAEIINERGGITVKGEKYMIELLTEDCRSNMDGVVSAANKLVYDKKVKFILGPPAFFSSGSSPLLTQNKVMNLLAWCTSQPGELGPDTPYTFLGGNGPLGMCRSGLAAMKKFNPNAKTACIVVPDDGAIPYITPHIKKAFQDYGLTPVGDTIGYPNEMVDFSPIAAKIIALNADLAVHTSGTPDHVGKITKALRERGNFKPYGGGIFGSAQELATIAGKEAATNVYTGNINLDDPLNSPLLKEVIKRISKKYGSRPVFIENANCLYILSQAIQAAQSLDPTVVKEKLEKMGKIETVWGPGTICGTKTYGIANHVVTNRAPQQLIEKGELKWSGYFDFQLP